MGSARDSAPDPKRASRSARASWPPGARPRPMSGISPVTPPRPPGGVPSIGDPKISSPNPVPLGVRPPAQQPKLLDRLAEALYARHYGPRTEQAYQHWVKRLIFIPPCPPPRRDGRAREQLPPEASRCAGKGERVDAEPCAQRLALPVSPRPLSPDRGLRRGRPDWRPTRLPAVLARAEVRAVLGHLTGDMWLMASLI